MRDSSDLSRYGVGAADRITDIEVSEPRNEQRQSPPVDALMRCLIFMTQQHGRPVSEADIRASCPLDAGGMTPETFLVAAQRLNYRAGQAEIDIHSVVDAPTPFVLLCSGQLPPAIVMTRPGGRFLLVDMVAGKTREAGADDIIRLGYKILLLKPLPPPDEQRGWRNLLTYRVRRVLVELVLASLVINLLALATPLFMMFVFNKVVGQQAMDSLNVALVIMLVVYAFDFMLRSVRGYISSHTGARVDALISGEVVHHLIRLPFRHFENTPTGLISERLRQLDVLRGFFTGQMPVLVIDLLFTAVFMLALFAIDTSIGFITLAAVPFFVMMSVLTHRAQSTLIDQNFMALAAKGSALSETVTNAVTVKALGLESEIERRWQGRVAAAAWTGFRANNLSNIIGTASGILQLVVTLLIIYVGVNGITESNMTIGALVAANILAGRALAPMRQVISAWHSLQSVRAAFRRLDEIMQVPTETAPGELSPVPALRGDIAFEHVYYKFDEDRPPILKDIDFKVPAGSVLGIIGPSGSGKTTISNLLQGLYMPSSGRVLMDQTDIGHISPAQLRSFFGVVPQDVQLFSGTVRENIAMGVADKDPTKVVAVARFVGAHGFIQRLPQGYNTVLGERGVGLSAGQRQMLCIARALIRNPRIIILDEATSALDPATEEQLLRQLKRNSRNRTIIIITHRLAPLSICDKVALLIDGRVERLGAPADVVAFARSRMADYARDPSNAAPRLTGGS